jgi:hypothetical protein
LFVILDDLRRPHLRFVRVQPDVAQGAALAQQIPALIELDPDLRQPLPIGFKVPPPLVQSVLLLHETLNVVQNRLVFGSIFHESLP